MLPISRAEDNPVLNIASVTRHRLNVEPSYGRLRSAMNADVAVVDNPALSRFEILADGEVAGFVDYRRTAAALSLTHTVIEPAFSGRGLGSALARGVLDTARDRDVSVLPFCPFIREYIQRHPAYLDLVRPEQRGRFSLTAGGHAAEGA